MIHAFRQVSNIPHLKAMLHHEDLLIQKLAISAIIELGDSDMLYLLLDMYHHLTDEVQAFIVKAFLQVSQNPNIEKPDFKELIQHFDDLRNTLILS
jgi:hypothetical protein